MQSDIGKIENIVGKNDKRTSVHNVWLDVNAGGTTGQLIATNGHMLAVVQCAVNTADVSGYITPEALKAARKARRAITANGALTIKDGAAFPRPTVENYGEFPNWRAVRPANLAAAQAGECDISFNAKYLLLLAEALDAKNGIVRILFQRKADGSIDELAPFTVVAGPTPGDYGVIVPCRV